MQVLALVHRAQVLTQSRMQSIAEVLQDGRDNGRPHISCEEGEYHSLELLVRMHTVCVTSHML